jgi:hypothetical protein
MPNRTAQSLFFRGLWSFLRHSFALLLLSVGRIGGGGGGSGRQGGPVLGFTISSTLAIAIALLIQSHLVGSFLGAAASTILRGPRQSMNANNNPQPNPSHAPTPITVGEGIVSSLLLYPLFFIYLLFAMRLGGHVIAKSAWPWNSTAPDDSSSSSSFGSQPSSPFTSLIDSLTRFTFFFSVNTVVFLLSFVPYVGAILAFLANAHAFSLYAFDAAMAGKTKQNSAAAAAVPISVRVSTLSTHMSAYLVGFGCIAAAIASQNGLLLNLAFSTTVWPFLALVAARALAWQDHGPMEELGMKGKGRRGDTTTYSISMWQSVAMLIMGGASSMLAAYLSLIAAKGVAWLIMKVVRRV